MMRRPSRTAASIPPPDGNVSLVASWRGDGEDVAKKRAAGHRDAKGGRWHSIIVVKKDEITPKVEIVDDTKPAPQLLPAGAPIVDLPAGPEPGDVLSVNTDFGVVHVLVPEGVSGGGAVGTGRAVEVAAARTTRRRRRRRSPGRTDVVSNLAEDVGAAQFQGRSWCSSFVPFDASLMHPSFRWRQRLVRAMCGRQAAG